MLPQSLLLPFGNNNDEGDNIDYIIVIVINSCQKCHDQHHDISLL